MTAEPAIRFAVTPEGRVWIHGGPSATPGAGFWCSADAAAELAAALIADLTERGLIAEARAPGHTSGIVALKMLGALAAGGPMRASEAAKRTGVGRRSAQRALQTAVTRGHATCEVIEWRRNLWAHVYALTPAGRAVWEARP